MSDERHVFAEMLGWMFDRQRQLMEKYREIEGLPMPPLALQHAKHQAVLKDFAWRTVEELTEAYQIWDEAPEGWSQQMIQRAVMDELADAWHFFVELLIFAGVTPSQCLYALHRRPFERDGEPYWVATYALGRAMHYLRAKPWKQTHEATNELAFRDALLDAFVALVALWPDGADAHDLWEHFNRKHEINVQRIAEKY